MKMADEIEKNHHLNKIIFLSSALSTLRAHRSSGISFVVTLSQ